MRQVKVIEMIEIERFTTDYSPGEDRMRLSGLDAGGQELVLWLTRRLLDLLVFNLCAGLEKHAVQHGPDGSTDALRKQAELGFAQQKALAHLQRSSPVQPTPQAPAWRVEEVDIAQGAGGARLTFKGVAEGEIAALVLPAAALRQWLGIMFELYRRAGWPVHVWPVWVEEAAAPSAVAAAAPVLH